MVSSWYLRGYIMFTINSFADVVAVARTFGVAALRHIVEKHTISMDAERMIYDCQKWAASKTIEIENVNDGNIEYSVDVVFKAERLGGDSYTNLDDLTITRTGFGSYSVGVREAMAKGYINADKLNKIMSEIKARNEASDVLFK